ARRRAGLRAQALAGPGQLRRGTAARRPRAGSTPGGSHRPRRATGRGPRRRTARRRVVLDRALECDLVPGMPRGCGQGQDAADLDEKTLVSFCRQAWGWLRAELEAQRRLLEQEPEKAVTVAHDL